jgi:hypothetical protein
MMDWIYIEHKYQQLRADYDRTWNNWVSCPTDELYEIMNVAKSRYFIFCTDVLEQLMEKKPRRFTAIKNWGLTKPPGV